MTMAVAGSDTLYAHAFCPIAPIGMTSWRSQSIVTHIMLWAAKGGGGGFGAAPKGKNKQKAPPRKAATAQSVQKKLQKAYGGASTPQEIAQATQKRVEAAMQDLPPHLQMATSLYQQLQKWNTQYERLSILQQANLPQAELDGAERAKKELERLCKEHDIHEMDLHNLFQKITWDASADAKAARSLTGKMPAEIARKIDRACELAAETVTSVEGGRCLDVGCGYGVLVPHLKAAGLTNKQIVGVDLSPEMIRNAEELYPSISFHAADFVQEFDSGVDKGTSGSEGGEGEGYNVIMFCSALHDMPDIHATLLKAAKLLRANGTLIVLHAQGASHVLKQVSANPVLVKRGLPDEQELIELLKPQGLELEVAPAPAGSPADTEEGYLAVLRKTGSA